MILKINPKNPQERLLRQAVAALTNGGLIAYPTDTCYAIGCDLYNTRGIARIYQMKRRPLNKPFSFICDVFKTSLAQRMYDWIARRRYRVFGCRGSCYVVNSGRI